MSKIPILSVIIPVYNAELTLEQCVNSIKEQSFSDYEVILIDDGSKDKSGELCDIYAGEDKRFKVIHTENHGVSTARNSGLEIVAGKYVMFVDSDDSIYGDFFEQYVRYIEENQKDVVIGGLVRKEKNQINLKKMSNSGEKSNEIWEQICISPEMYGYIAGKIFRLEIIKENNIRFNTKMYAQEDLDFNLSVYERCSKFQLIDYAGYEYEYTPGKRKPPVWDFLANSMKLYKIASSKIELSDDAKDALKGRVASQIFSFLYNCGSKNDFKFAVQKLREVSTLDDYLKRQKLKGESKMIIKWFLNGKYEQIYKYFTLRKKIKKLLGLPVSE